MSNLITFIRFSSRPTSLEMFADANKKKPAIVRIDETAGLPFYHKVFRCLIALLLFLPIAVLTSCVEGEEEIWINADASGRATARYEFPTKALEELGDPADLLRAIERIDENEEGLEFQTCSFEKVGFNTALTIEATFENALDLLTIAERNQTVITEETSANPETLDGVAGKIDFQFEGINPTYDRAVSISSLFPADLAPLKEFALRAALRRAAFKYTLHVPSEILETNATQVSDDRKTATWIFPLKEHFEAPIQMSLKMRPPIPWWAWLILALLIAGIGWPIWRLIRRRKA